MPVDFDIKKEFFEMQDDFDDGVWIGLLNEALSGEDSSGDTAECIHYRHICF